jgi:hypothetical protein
MGAKVGGGVMTPAKRKKWRERRIRFIVEMMKSAPNPVPEKRWRKHSDEVITAAYRAGLVIDKLRKLERRYPGALLA